MVGKAANRTVGWLAVHGSATRDGHCIHCTLQRCSQLCGNDGKGDNEGETSEGEEG
jgi:hypothetical protein